MPKQLFSNNATSTLSGVLSQGGTTLVCSAGDGNKFPTPSGGDYFLITLFTKDTYSVEQNVEVVKVTARVGDTMTIVRDVENLVGVAGGNAYNGILNTVYIEQRWTAMGASNTLQAEDNLAALKSAATARTNLGLGNVNNTADVDKPISTATQTALNGKSDLTHNHDTAYEAKNVNIQAHIASTANPHGVTKAQIGLGNVDNTSDLNKPISTATQTALNGKAATGHTHAGVYEPADATILKDADIGVTVQAYDADLTSWAGIAPTAKQDTLVSGTNIKTVNNTTLLGAGNVSVEPVITAGTTAQYWRGDKTWQTLPTGGDASTNTATSVDSEVVLFSGTGGKTLKRATGSGLAKLTSGVLSTATAGTDYQAPLVSGTNIKTVNGNSLLGSGDLTIGGAPSVSVVTNTSQAATANTQYVLTNAAATTVTLPAAPNNGDIIWVTVANGRSDNVIACSGKSIQGVAENMTLDAAYAAVQLRYIDATLQWRIV